MQNDLTLFEDYNIRRVYDEKTETWFFSVVDVVAALTEQNDFQAARKYWKVLKGRLLKEGSEVVTKCYQLKLPAEDGKMRLTDVADTEALLRLVQSVPSPKAEPFKLWLAKVGYERMQEMANPELAVDRARETWIKQGRSEEWIETRLKGITHRNELTDYWKNHEIKLGVEYATLTSIIHQEWSGVTLKQHRTIKELDKPTQNLRDHMNSAELLFTALAEISAKMIAESTNATGLDENKVASKQGGSIAKNARLELENQTGKKVVSSENHLLIKNIVENEES
jgi:hypothetical protein